YRIALQAAFAFFGSLLLHPRRKCDLPKDHSRRLDELKGGAAETFRGETRARQLVLAARSTRDGFSLAEIQSAMKLHAGGTVPVFMAARWTGFILAREFHSRWLGGERALHEWTRFLLRPVSSRTNRRSKSSRPWQDRYSALRALCSHPNAREKTELSKSDR